ncbi:TPA: site-specific DNA methylase [Aquificae Joseph's Coat Spring virus]|nr:TPA: site-specific DNA methylase [Aquificae Joseph's Coat Spring virus]
MEYQKPVNFFSYMGGKHLLAKTIVKLIPQHKRYVEPFGGSGKVLFAKAPSEIEVINDADKKIANLFYCVAFHFDEFWHKAKWLLHSREILKVFETQIIPSPPAVLGDVNHAIATYYALKSCFSGKGGFAYEIKNSSESKMVTKGVLTLRAIRKRLKYVIIEAKDFEDLMRRWDTEETFFYCDPPYFGAEHYYDIPFTKRDHERLLSLLKQTKGKWILSGYHNELYATALKGYPYIEKQISKSSYGVTQSSKNKTRPLATEVLWFNFDPDKETLKELKLELVI